MPYLYATDYTPDLPSGFNAGDETELGYDETMALLKKRPKFPEEIREALEQALGMNTRERAPGGQAELQYKCGSCGQFGEGSNMHIGHKVNWKDYLKEKQPLSVAAAFAAYCDLDNLHFEHLVCNTSHIFENSALDEIAGGRTLQAIEPASRRQELLDKLQKLPLFRDMSRDEVLKLDLNAIFMRLASRYEDTGVTSGVILEVEDEQVGDEVPRKVEILLAEPVVTHGESDRCDIDELERPAWDKSTRAGLLAIWKGNGWTETFDGILHYRCGSCGNWGEGYSMHIGHVTNWKNYVKHMVGERDTETNTWRAVKSDALYAYNDLNNLRFEHPTCNMGGEWEEEKSALIPEAVLAQWREDNAKNSALIGKMKNERDGMRHLAGIRQICRVAISEMDIQILQHRGEDDDENVQMDDIVFHDVDVPITEDWTVTITADELLALKTMLEDRRARKRPDDTLVLGGMRIKQGMLQELDDEQAIEQAIEQIDNAERTLVEHIVYEVFRSLSDWDGDKQLGQRAIRKLVIESFGDDDDFTGFTMKDAKRILEEYDRMKADEEPEEIVFQHLDPLPVDALKVIRDQRAMIQRLDSEGLDGDGSSSDEEDDDEEADEDDDDQDDDDGDGDDEGYDGYDGGDGGGGDDDSGDDGSSGSEEDDQDNAPRHGVKRTHDEMSDDDGDPSSGGRKSRDEGPDRKKPRRELPPGGQPDSLKPQGFPTLTPQMSRFVRAFVIKTKT